MRKKIIYSNYNEETGVSKVIIHTELGQFEGQVILHEEDKNIVSSFAGCRYAEMRAIRKYLKRKNENIKYEIKGLKDCENIIKSLKDYNFNSKENRKIRRRIFELEKDRKIIKEQIKNIDIKIVELMDEREKILKSLNKNKKENN